jgi:hypothetical protein
MKGRIFVAQFFSYAVSKQLSSCVVFNGTLKDLMMNNSLLRNQLWKYIVKRKKNFSCSAYMLSKTGVWICIGESRLHWKWLIDLKCWDRDNKDKEANVFITILLA